MKDLSLSSSGPQVPEVESPVFNEQDPDLPREFLNLSVSMRNRLEIFENGPTAMLVCGSDGRIVDVNARCLEMFGYTREELIGENLETLVPRHHQAAHKGHREHYLREPRPRPMDTGRDLWGLRKDGSEVLVEIDLGTMDCDQGTLAVGVIRDRSKRTLATQQLESEAEFGRAISVLSTKFINLPANRVDEEITDGLKTLGEAMDGDRATVGLIESESGDLLITHAWARAGLEAFPKRLLSGMLPWLFQRLKEGETVAVGTPEDLPPEGHVEREYMLSQGHKSSLVVPLKVAGNVVGAFAFSCFRHLQKWDASTISRFQAMADVFANALARKEADEKLQTAYAEIQQLKEQLEQENSYLRQEIKLEYGHKIVVGKSQAMRAVLKKAEQVASTDSSVLILGETGTGKELIARTIHELSQRNNRALVKTNCAALPATLIESELFGREKGAYTGALAREIGRFELADRATIFLDEIGELPPETQSKLLRILQEGEFERLGSSKTIKVNVRVIAATSRDLSAMVKEGRFRSDLFYRLNVFPIVVPPLRERVDDIPEIVWHVLEEFGTRFGRTVDGVQASTMRKFQKYAWPGNVRELRNIIERNLILNPGPMFKADIPEMDEKAAPKMRRLGEVESEHFERVLHATNWRIRGKGGAAEILGLKPTTLEARMKKLGIIRPT